MKHAIKTVLAVLLITACVFSLISCRRISAEELSRGYERKVMLPSGIEDEQIKVISDFGLSVFKNSISPDGGNQIFSPLSAIVCLALITNGTDGETLEQIETMLGCDINTLNKGLLSYSYDILFGDSPVNIANSLWINADSEFKASEDFLQKNANYYSAQIYSAEFDNKTLKDINKWCEEQTDGMIKQILSQIDGSALIYMINAMTFEAEWESKYKNNNIIDSFDFKNYDESISDVTALHSEESIYLPDEKAVGFIKNYKGNRFSFAALLPNEEVDIYEYIASLDGERWTKIWNNRARGEVNVKLPEFKCDSEMDLAKTMKMLGVTDMFSPECANFSRLGISDNRNIYCNIFKQKASIQVDRNGTKAAAVTNGLAGEGAQPVRVNVFLNRPFVYAIVDNDTGIPIFIGCVTNLG